MRLRSVGLRTGEQILQGIREAAIWRADQQAAQRGLASMPAAGLR